MEDLDSVTLNKKSEMEEASRPDSPSVEDKALTWNSTATLDHPHEDHGKGAENEEKTVDDVPASSTPPDSSTDKIKVTLSFMKAYNAMRNSGDAETDPLFASVANPDVENQERDETKMLKQVQAALDDVKKPADPDEPRQAVFTFARPPTASVVFANDKTHPETSLAVMYDYVPEHAVLDQGWTEANRPDPDGKSQVSFPPNPSHAVPDSKSHVSDNEGPPVDSRITPAVFRALASGCHRDDVDHPCSSSDLQRPRTPPAQILGGEHRVLDMDMDMEMALPETTRELARIQFQADLARALARAREVRKAREEQRKKQARQDVAKELQQLRETLLQSHARVVQTRERMVALGQRLNSVEGRVHGMRTQFEVLKSDLKDEEVKEKEEEEEK